MALNSYTLRIPGSKTPNEPAGYTRIINRHFNDKAADNYDRGDSGSLPDIIGGSEGWDGSEYNEAWAQQTDAAAPDPSGIAKFTVLAGTAAVDGNLGGGAAQTQAFTGTAMGSLSLKGLYVSFSVYIDPSWVGHSTGVNKLAFFRGGSDQRSPDNVLTAAGAGSNDLLLNWNTQGGWYNPGNLSANYPSAGSPNEATMARGMWHRVEAQLVANTPGVQDGVLRLWLNGVKTHEFTNMGYFAFGETVPFFDQFHIGVLWGGTGGTLVASQYVKISDTYISGKE